MSKEKLENKRELSPIQRFMCICAGVDKEILKQCPTEWNKYTGIGATILFTGVLATLSGGYALYTVFRSGDLSITDTSALFPAFAFGILWGLIIFNLDRFIVSTFHKSEESVWWKKWGQELLHASPRIILAIIIAIVISKPVEIKIFESRLAEQIQQNEIAARKRNQSSFEEINNISGKTQDIAAKEKKGSILQQELADDPQIVKDLISNELATAKSELATAQRINNPKIENHNQSIRNIRNNQNNYRPVYDAEGNVVRDDNGNIRQSLTREAQNNIGSHNTEIRNLRNEIAVKQKEVDRINNLIAEERKSYKAQKQAEIVENKQAQKVAEAKLDSAKVKVDEEKAGADKTSKQAFTNNFITQIEALGDLTDSDSTMNIVSWFLTLLFLTIELAPILTKLITKRGSYDEILDRTEYELMVEQKEIISRKNSEINALLIQAEEAAKLNAEVRMKADKDKLDVELQGNKAILDDIAQKQQELAKKAIDKWYEEEKIKLNS